MINNFIKQIMNSNKEITHSNLSTNRMYSLYDITIKHKNTKGVTNIHTTTKVFTYKINHLFSFNLVCLIIVRCNISTIYSTNHHLSIIIFYIPIFHHKLYYHLLCTHHTLRCYPLVYHLFYYLFHSLHHHSK